MGVKFFSGAAKVMFLAGSVSTDGTNKNSNAGQFADLVKFRDTIL